MAPTCACAYFSNTCKNKKTTLKNKTQTQDYMFNKTKKGKIGGKDRNLF